MTEQKIINKYIGGFFEMAVPEAIVNKSILSDWGVEANQCPGFINARSALSALLRHLKADRILLPAYSCTSIQDACAGHKVEFYPLTTCLDPDIDFLDEATSPGDVILAINFFGKPPSHQFLEFVKQREDIIFIEDCAQSLSTGISQWGDWRLFSPRKLVGVADGGFVVPRNINTENLSVDLLSDGSVCERWRAALSRFEDKEGAFNSLWYSSHQMHEQSMKVENRSISFLSQHILLNLDIDSIIHKRKNNYKILQSALSSWGLLKDHNPDYAPFGFPLRVPEAMREKLFAALIHDNIFPAIHWRDLAAPASHFKFEHQLSKELLTLPCDQRYQSEDMDYIAASVHRFFSRLS